MAIYQKFCNELKLEIWEKAAMVPGMHFFKMYVDRLNYGTINDNLEMQLPIIFHGALGKVDPSAWRQRRNLLGIDAAADRVMTNLINKPSTKVWPEEPLDEPEGLNGALIFCEQDVVCIQVIGLITATWVRPVLNPGLFVGIKRVCIEFDSQYVHKRYPRVPFGCLCSQKDHEEMIICPVMLDKFLSYFPDLEKCYLMKSLATDDVHPFDPFRLLGFTQHEHGQWEVKYDVEAYNRPRMTRAQAAEQRLKETYEKFRDIAQRENLASFEDMNNHYYEVRESDSKVLVAHELIWALLHGVQNLWGAQKATPNLGHEVKEVELGLLVYTVPPKPESAPRRRRRGNGVSKSS